MFFVYYNHSFFYIIAPTNAYIKYNVNKINDERLLIEYKYCGGYKIWDYKW